MVDENDIEKEENTKGTESATENDGATPVKASAADIPDDEEFESDVDYTTVLDVFEGPLDLLLHLINIAKINIEDIFVSKVTEQFLQYIDYMKTQPSRDVDKESEYLAIAAQIIYIKSKSLVPAIEYDDITEDSPYDDEDEREFIEKLKQREFELIQEETPKLRDLETYGYCYKEPEKEYVKTHVVYRDLTLDGLLMAFAKLMMRNESLKYDDGDNDYREIPKDVYTVPEKITYIKNKVLDGGRIKFEDLFDSYSRNEVITTFQALLEMLKFQYIMVEQEEIFTDIYITINPDWDLKEVADYEFDKYD